MCLDRARVEEGVERVAAGRRRLFTLICSARFRPLFCVYVVYMRVRVRVALRQILFSSYLLEGSLVYEFQLNFRSSIMSGRDARDLFATDNRFCQIISSRCRDISRKV